MSRKQTGSILITATTTTTTRSLTCHTSATSDESQARTYSHLVSHSIRNCLTTMSQTY